MDSRKDKIMNKEKYNLRADKNQKEFDDRLKNNKMNVIKHERDKDAESCSCRICHFSDVGKNMLAKSKRHAQRTGHTVDVYYETWREVNYYKK